MLDPMPDLPPELAALDAELRALTIEERPSFAPELEAELRRVGPGSEPLVESGGRRRMAVAASIALLMATFAVPPARGSLTMVMERIRAVLEPATPAVLGAEAPAPAMAMGGESALAIVGSVPSTELPKRVLPDVGPAIEADPFRRVSMVAPRAIDVEEQRSTIRRFYPPSLQQRGIGGIVGVLMFVDSTGAARQPEVNRTSGRDELDRAALRAAPRLRFRPATRDGRPFSTWVKFDVVFEPDADVLPTPRGVDRPDLPVATSFDVPPEWAGPAALPAPIMQETLELLRDALGDDAAAARLGTLEGVVHGEPPAGTDPLAWREAAARALEGAMLRAPDNPAPFLALARIRRKQGLPADARQLLERGIQRAEQGKFTVSPRLTAELNYELAAAARDAGYAWSRLGRLPAEALAAGSCGRAGVQVPGGEVTPETLIAWNYLCPTELRRILDRSFEEVGSAGEEREAMLRSLRAAVAADPAHIGANVGLLLDLAERDDARAMLNGARRFGLASGGHPYARLLAGVAQHQMGHAEDALRELEAGLAGLSAEEAARVRDITPLLDPTRADGLERMGAVERSRAEKEFWVGLDPILSTDVNERMVAHLARSAYAHLRLGGARTEAGDVWVRYGEPARVRTFGEGTALRTEMWDYGEGPAITFRRPAASAALGLTPEARAYLDDLRRTRPNAYGGAGRALLPLTAETARFRASNGRAQVDVTIRIPEALASADRPLEIALVQLDGRGARVGIDRQRASPGAGPLRLRVDAETAAQRLVVEVYSPSLERVAVLQTTFDRAVEKRDARVSDLQLTAAMARPRREVERGARGIEALATSRITGSEVGVLFELYEAPGLYQLRAELVPAAGGAPTPVEIRPAGEPRYGASFSRTRWPGPTRATEYFSARLVGVAPGVYTLRVIAEAAGAPPIVLERAIERR